MTNRRAGKRAAGPDPAAGEVLRVPAIQLRQGPNRLLYTMTVDGKDLPRIARVSRVRRDEDFQIEGYQRPEALAHIASIRKYLESGDPLLANSLVIAFDKRVAFEPLEEGAAPPCHGTLVIPLVGEGEDKPGFIVDGQQRAAALRAARVDSFDVAVNAFVTDDAAEQRSQFILVNNTKPLPRGLIYELLPTTTGVLPDHLQVARFRVKLSERLNFDEGSPFERLIQTPTNPDGYIKDNSVLKMLGDRLTDGALYQFRNPKTGEGDVEKMLVLLKAFWGAVAEVFPDAWSRPPRQSRLTHGVGIVSMGYVMDEIVDRYAAAGRRKLPTKDVFAEDLSALAEVCAWTGGFWGFGPEALREWNALQNISRDIQQLTNFLRYEYRARLVDAPAAKASQR